MKCLFIVTGRGLGGDAMTALNEMKRILRSGGLFICSFPVSPDVELVLEDPSPWTSPLTVHYLKSMATNGIGFQFLTPEATPQPNCPPLKGLPN